jgi:hypothetical protein
MRVLLAATIAAAVAAAPANAAPPAPCAGPQITDPTGDGHHTNTDVVAAWLTEAGGRVQAVIQTSYGLWEPAHEDSETAGFALLYQQGAETRYVRATVTRGAPPTYDTGTWNAGFTSTGAIAGAVTTGPNGTVTMDVPAAGGVLARPFALTYDGESHWVDRAPGGTTPDGTEFGADYVVGGCTPGTPGTPADPGQAPGPQALSAIALKAPSKLTGSGTARITGQVSPARAGVSVAITAQTRSAVTRRVTTAGDGSFSLSLPVSETTRVRAEAEGLGSQTLTVRMFSKVRIKIRRTKTGGAVVTGTTSPKLSGRILWLRTDDVRPSARTTARSGRFTLRLTHPKRGRYQAVFIPSGDRAERSTSNTGVIR